MAVGATGLAKLRECENNMLSICNGPIPSSFGTINYVVKYLDNWADETTIGKDLKDDLLKLVSSIDSLNERTKELCSKMEEFIDQQETINATSSY